MKTFSLFSVALTIISFTVATSASSRDLAPNSDLPFGFWFGGHGQVRRQGRDGGGAPLHLQTRTGRSVSPSLRSEEASSSMADKIANILLNKMDKQGQENFIGLLISKLASAEDPRHARWNQLASAEEPHYVKPSQDIGYMHMPFGKRSPEIVENLSQFNHERGLFAMDFHGNPVYFEKPAAPHTKEAEPVYFTD